MSAGQCRRWLVETRFQDALERRMDPSKRASIAVDGLNDLSGEVVIEITRHDGSASCMSGNRSERSVFRIVCGFSNDRGVASIGPSLADVQVSDVAHSQCRQVGDECAFVAGDSYRKCADGRRPIGDERQSTASLELGDEGSQLDLVVGLRLVVHTRAVSIERNGVMLDFPTSALTKTSTAPRC